MPTEKFPSACDYPIQTWFQSRAVPSESRVLLCSKHMFTSNEQPASGIAMRDIEVKLDPRIAELSPPFVQREHLTLPANQ